MPIPIAALIAMLPALLDAGTQAAGLIHKLTSEGRTQTTAEETAALQAALSAAQIADARFDQAFGVNET